MLLLAGRSPDDALADYSRDRDAATANGFRLTLRTAALDPVPEPLLRYYARAASDPEEVRLILGALGGAPSVRRSVFARTHRGQSYMSVAAIQARRKTSGTR